MIDLTPQDLRTRLDAATYSDEANALVELVETAALNSADRAAITQSACALIRAIRDSSDPGMMEVFLAEYGLSTDEGVSLMCLAEALLRVPDADTIDALIEDKIAPSNWGKHLGHSTSSLVNASTWALMLTGRVLQEDTPGPVGHLRGAIRRLGEPVIRTAVARAMKEMGRQFVLGETILKAIDRAKGMEDKGFTYSYDMLGEAAKTAADAKRYHLSYARAIAAIADAAVHDDIRANPGISVKLSALHPRYELAQQDRVMTELVPSLRALALLAKSAGIGLNVDAEEADRLALSLDVIETVLSEPALADWDGFGVVVQAYSPRASHVIDVLYEMAQRFDRKIMIRLVKGAYWDSEIKHAQVEGLEGFPVFTHKQATDVSYIANARKLLGMTDRIYPQFATHNAHTIAAILYMADDPASYEFQRLHGMGETLHKIVLADNGTRCRIYAPVGAHRDLLAYLVRRLLENGANSSFVNQIVDETVSPETIAKDPFEAIEDMPAAFLPRGPEMYAPERSNSMGFDLAHAPTLVTLNAERDPFKSAQWHAAPLVVEDVADSASRDIYNPADPSDLVGTVSEATEAHVHAALAAAQPWTASAAERHEVLNRAANLYEANHGEIFALLAREAGKSIPDAVGELREAVDFLRYYAARTDSAAPAGLYTCISPWNFPLAIYTGQISAALAAGNAVLAKPAEQTPLIAQLAARLMIEAGVPPSALQVLPGAGHVGAALTRDPRINGVAFTGSTQTAQAIRRTMADHLAPGAPFLAETGGLNAMIVDSTALPEQAVTAIVESAFQSAGQRCSALRCLYVQEDIADTLIPMLIGAMSELRQGMPWDLAVDVGPVIDEAARSMIADYIDAARIQGRVMHELQTPVTGTFVAPTLIKVGGISEMKREIFGPVLHVATFKSRELDTVIDDINATGYGLTFGLQTRIDDRVQYVTERITAGNIYVNRNQIGAIVGSQPFGGHGLSGTGPKAGGPHYLDRFRKALPPPEAGTWDREMQAADVQSALTKTAAVRDVDMTTLPGPTGETNRLSTYSRAPILCMGPGAACAQAQANAVRDLGGTAVIADGTVAPDALAHLTGLSGALWWGAETSARAYAQALSKRSGPILPLITGMPDTGYTCTESHLCVDTTASGGNAALLSGMA